jgi:hypothetical protein
MTAAMTNGKPPTTLRVMNVVHADKPFTILLPKLSDRLLSIPRARYRNSAVQYNCYLTFEVFSETIEQSSPRNSVMEANVGEKNTFQKP